MLKESYPRPRNAAFPRYISASALPQACMLAIAAAFALNAGPAIAKTSAKQETELQLQADQAAQRSERMQLKADQLTLKADTRSGRMAAESKDAEKVYKDQQAIKGENQDIAVDKPGSLQIKEDKSVLAGEQKQLKADRQMLRADAKSGKMAAESQDAEKVYNDRQFLRGERKDIAADKAGLKAYR